MKEELVKTLKFLAWICVGIPVLAFLLYRVMPATKPSVNRVATTQMRQPANGAQASRGSAPNNGVTSGRYAQPHGRGVAQTPTTISDLYQLLSQPQCEIATITFHNGENNVLVDFKNGAQKTVLVPDDGGKHDLRKKAVEAKVAINVEEHVADPILGFVGKILPYLFIGFVIWMVVRSTRKGMQQQFAGMSKSRAKKLTKGQDGVADLTWTDIAGCDEAVTELKLVVESHTKRKKWFSIFKVKVPKGYLLVGPPGTGKTLLVKILANEMDADVTVCAGSEFIEMFKGTGAARLRDSMATMTAEAKRTGRIQVFFIDELDALGLERSSGINDTSETLNQLLVEMDGVVGNDKIIFFAATNRVELLDKALLRPGRFSKQILVDAPDLEGRRKILDIHLRGKLVAEDVDLDSFAARIYGFTGAMIKGLVENASLMAIKRLGPREDDLRKCGLTDAQIDEELKSETLITAAELDAGADEVTIGMASTSKQRNIRLADKKQTAIHESGHARLCQILAPHADTVGKVTIMRTANYLGYVLRIPDFNKVSMTREDAIASILVAMAGRAAQELVLETCDSGARGDFEQASDTAYSMVCEWGMSRVGHISVKSRSNASGQPTRGGNSSRQVGPNLLNRLDDEWTRICEACFACAQKLVAEDRPGLEALADQLMLKETVLADEVGRLAVEYPLPKVDMKAIVQEILFTPNSNSSATISNNSKTTSNNSISDKALQERIESCRT